MALEKLSAECARAGQGEHARAHTANALHIDRQSKQHLHNLGFGSAAND